MENNSNSFAEMFRKHLCDCVLHSTCSIKSTVYNKIKSIFKYYNITINNDDTINVDFGNWRGNKITYKYKLCWVNSQNSKFHRLAAIEIICDG